MSQASLTLQGPPSHLPGAPHALPRLPVPGDSPCVCSAYYVVSASYLATRNKPTASSCRAHNLPGFQKHGRWEDSPLLFLSTGSNALLFWGHALHQPTSPRLSYPALLFLKDGSMLLTEPQVGTGRPCPPPHHPQWLETTHDSLRAGEGKEVGGGRELELQGMGSPQKWRAGQAWGWRAGKGPLCSCLYCPLWVSERAHTLPL